MDPEEFLRRLIAAKESIRKATRVLAPIARRGDLAAADQLATIAQLWEALERPRECCGDYMAIVSLDLFETLAKHAEQAISDFSTGEPH